MTQYANDVLILLDLDSVLTDARCTQISINVNVSADQTSLNTGFFLINIIMKS